jgi:hypothetical protein
MHYFADRHLNSASYMLQAPVHLSAIGSSTSYEYFTLEILDNNGYELSCLDEFTLYDDNGVKVSLNYTLHSTHTPRTLLIHCALYVYTAHSTYTLRTLLIHCPLYSYTVHSTYTLRTLLVHCALYLYTMHFIFEHCPCTLLVHCALYSYTAHSTRTLYTLKPTIVTSSMSVAAASGHASDKVRRTEESVSTS